MTDEELKALAFKYLDGRVITSQAVPQDLWHSVFMPLMFVKNPKTFLRGVRMVYAIVGEDHAGGWAVNGWPTFMSMRFLKARDFKKFRRYVDEAQQLRDKFIKG